MINLKINDTDGFDTAVYRVVKPLLLKFETSQTSQKPGEPPKKPPNLAENQPNHPKKSEKTSQKPAKPPKKSEKTLRERLLFYYSEKRGTGNQRKCH